MHYNSDQTGTGTVHRHWGDSPGPGIRFLIGLLLLAVPCLGLATPSPQAPIPTEAVQAVQRGDGARQRLREMASREDVAREFARQGVPGIQAQQRVAALCT